MKQLLIYTGPNKKFTQEDFLLAKIQIDNYLDLNQTKDELLLVTDFPFEYNGIKTFVIPDHLYYDFDVNANKILVVNYLLKNNMLEKNQIYWCHDFDAFENFKITEEELKLQDVDLGLTHYTYKEEWQCGSFFFKSNSQNIFELIDKTTREKPHLSRNNEKTLTKLIKENKIDPKRYKRLNVTYNIMKKYLGTIYPLADKPLKILHFRPSDALDVFMHGDNSLKMVLMSDRLIKIFNKHGYK